MEAKLLFVSSHDQNLQDEVRSEGRPPTFLANSYSTRPVQPGSPTIATIVMRLYGDPPEAAGAHVGKTRASVRKGSHLRGDADPRRFRRTRTASEYASRVLREFPLGLVRRVTLKTKPGSEPAGTSQKLEID